MKQRHKNFIDWLKKHDLYEMYEKECRNHYEGTVEDSLIQDDKMIKEYYNHDYISHMLCVPCSLDKEYKELFG